MPSPNTYLYKKTTLTKVAFQVYSNLIYPLCYFLTVTVLPSFTDTVPFIMPYSIIIAGMHWITTTKAQKPRKSRISGPLTKTLLVTPDEARAAVLVKRLRAAVLNTVDKVFMTVLLLSTLAAYVR